MIHRTVVSFLLLCLSAGLFDSSAHAADWARFRGPNGSAVSEARGVPTEWSDSKNLA